MAKLTEIWIENREGKNPAIRLDWSNDRYHRIELNGDSPAQVLIAISRLAQLIERDLLGGYLQGVIDMREITKSDLLDKQVLDHVNLGSHGMDGSLGIQKMPDGYALMLNRDKSHFYWLRHDGLESCICWDKWAVYRGAKRDSENPELLEVVK